MNETKFVICAGTTADIPKEVLKEKEIEIIPASIQFKNQILRISLLSRLGAIEEFYRRARSGEKITVLTPSIDEYINFFVDVLARKQKDILYFAQLNAVDAAYINATTAAKAVMEANPQFHIKIVSTRSFSLGIGLLIYCLMEENGRGRYLDIQSAAEFIESMSIYINTIIYKCTRNKQIDKKPSNWFNKKYCFSRLNKDSGEIVVNKYHSKLKCFERMLVSFDSRCIDKTVVFIAHGDSIHEASKIKHYLLEHYPDIHRIVLTTSGPFTGIKYGPGNICVFFFGPERDTINNLCKKLPSKFHIN